MGLSISRADDQTARTALAEFRYRSYVEELGIRLPGADHRRRLLWDALDSVSVSYAIWDGDCAVGSLRITYLSDVPDLTPFVEKFGFRSVLDRFDPGVVCVTSRFIVDARVRHGTASLRLMEAGFREAVERVGVRFNFGDCSPHMVPFYEHMGYRRYARSYNDPAYGFKLPIVMLLRDPAWFRQVRSPLLRISAEYPADLEASDWFRVHYPASTQPLSSAFLSAAELMELAAQRSAVDLYRQDLFAGLGSAAIERLLARGAIFRAKPGDRLLRAGEVADSLFIVLTGGVRAKEMQRGRPDVSIPAGQCFGRVANLALQSASGAIVAVHPSELLSLPSDTVERSISKDPDLREQLLQNLARAPGRRRARAA